MSKPNIVSNKERAVKVRDLLNFKPTELVNGLRVNLNVLFEDGVVIRMGWGELTLNRFLLDILTLNNELPITSKYCIINYYNNGRYVSKTIKGLMDVMIEDIVKSAGYKYGRKVIPELTKKIYEVHNAIYNDMVYNLLDYAGSIDIEDLLEIQKEPALIEAIREVDRRKDVTSINEAYAVLDMVIRSKPDNIISKGYISSIYNPNQIKQLLGPRGFITEINGDIFKHPIASSFVLGMNSMYDVSVESRAAAKALYLATNAVRQSEYIAREMQLVSMYIQHIWYGDCGTKEYTNWYVEKNEDGRKSDLPLLAGKWYLNEETQQEEIITVNHTHLEGTTIKLRMLQNCKLEDKRCVCSKCYGELAWSIPEHANIGHFSSAFITHNITQNLLSSKHMIASAVGSTIKLSEIAKQYLTTKSGNMYVFRPGLLGKVKTKYDLLIKQDEAFGIKDINENVNVNTLRPDKVTRIKEIILVEKGATEKYIKIPIKDSNKYGSFTYKFLEYIKNKSFTLDNRNRYVINLDTWNNNTPFIQLDNLEFNYLDMITAIRKELKYMKSDKASFKDETPESFTVKLHDLLNSKLNIPLVHTEVVVLAHTIADPENGNYDIARNNPNKGLTNYQKILSNRSLGAGFAWERVMQMIVKTPLGYENKNLASHPMDVFLRPNEVVEDFKHRGPYLRRD